MSDIVFRNMEMPDSCYNCPFRDGVYCFFPETDEKIKVSLDVVPVGRHEDCPLIELPPHGDLKDSTLFYKKVAEKIHNIPQNEDGTVDKVSRYYMDGLAVAMNLLASIETILGGNR